jgi:hypothetical protein
MLIEPPVKLHDIVCMKLANGDEVIAKIYNLTDEVITVGKPHLMMLGQHPNGQPGVQMVPFWMLGGNESTQFPINRKHVVCLIKASDDAKKGYMAHTSSILQPGATNGLVTS